MKIVNEVPLSEIQKLKEAQQTVPLTLDALGLQLVQEKLDHSQTKELVNSLGQQFVQEKLEHSQTKQLLNTLGQELVQTKLKIANLEGGNA